MFNTMYRRGTVAATPVAGLPQGDSRGTLTEPRIRQRVPNGTDVQRPNPGFAGYRGPQLPSKHHGSARLIFPSLAMTSASTRGEWHSNWINSDVRFDLVLPGLF